MHTLLHFLSTLLAGIIWLVTRIGRLTRRLGRYWIADIRRRKTAQGKVASFSIGMFALLCICSLPVAWFGPDRPSPATHATVRQAIAASPTVKPAAMSEGDPVTPASVLRQSPLRENPSALATSIGVVCPGDRLQYVAQHQSVVDYVRVTVQATGPACDDRHVRAGAEGWIDMKDVRPPSGGLTALPTTTPQPSRIPTVTPPPPPVGQVSQVINVRSEPRVDPQTVVAKLCPGDSLAYVSMQQVGDELWFRVRVLATGSACDPLRASVGAEGWAAASVLAEPSYDIRQYAMQAGITLPTAIPPTAVPTRAPPPPPAAPQRCDPSYPDFCLPPGIADLDCPDIPYRRFRVVGVDPHGFDRDRDGIGCER